MKLTTDTIQLLGFSGKHAAGGSVYVLTLAGVLTATALDELAASDPSVMAWLDGDDGEVYQQNLRTGAAFGELQFSDAAYSLANARVKSAAIKIERNSEDAMASIKLAIEVSGEDWHGSVRTKARDGSVQSTAAVLDARLGQRPHTLLYTGADAEVALRRSAVVAAFGGME